LLDRIGLREGGRGSAKDGQQRKHEQETEHASPRKRGPALILAQAAKMAKPRTTDRGDLV
jgi:hypothetical protein